MCVSVCVCAHTRSVMSDSLHPQERSPSGSSVHEASQARILEWFPFPPPEDLPDPGVLVSLASPSLAGGFFTTEPPGKPGIKYIYCLPFSQGHKSHKAGNCLSYIYPFFIFVF